MCLGIHRCFNDGTDLMTQADRCSSGPLWSTVKQPPASCTFPNLLPTSTTLTHTHTHTHTHTQKWNVLPEEAVCAKNIHRFKEKYDRTVLKDGTLRA